MTRKTKLLAVASSMALTVLGSTAGHAAGTTAGSTITNNVTVNYQVGGVSQTAVSDSDAFIVDRKINLTVAELGTATTSVSPGQTGAVTSFTVTNTSNELLDFALAVSQPVGGAAPHGGTDNFNVTTPQIYRDANGNNTYDAGTDTLVTFLDELAADASVTVFVVSSVPIAQVNGDRATVALTATAREGGTAATQGAAITETTGANTAAKDTVFADTAGTDDAARSGSHSARDDYTVAAAALSVNKTSRVISDPFNNTTNPKMIPGAVVEYCIAVTNAAGGAAASTVAIADPLPTQTTYVSTFGILINGTTTGVTCNADGTSGGAYNAGTTTVSGTIPSVAAGDTRTVIFRVTVN